MGSKKKKKKAKSDCASEDKRGCRVKEDDNFVSCREVADREVRNRISPIESKETGEDLSEVERG